MLWNLARLIAVLAIAASAPVMLISYAWGLRLLFEQIGLLWMVPICAANVIVWLGIASLFDKRQQPPRL